MVDIQELVRQAQEMQNKVRLAQDELSKITVEGTAGGGLVKVTMTCLKKVLKVEIDPSCLVNKSELEDLLVAAFNNGKEKAEEVSTATMEEATNGLELPAGLDVPM